MNGIGPLIDTLSGASLTVSALELSLLMIILSACLVFRFSKTGLIAAYLFCYKLGWIVMSSHSQSYMIGYLVFGVIVGVVTVIGMLKTDH